MILAPETEGMNVKKMIAETKIEPQHRDFGFTISIVTYNTWTRTMKCIQSMVHSARIDRVSFEILVIDNGHEPAPCELDVPELRVIRAGANLGFGGGNNVALRQATYDHFLILNPDTTIREGFLLGLKRTLDDFPAASAVAPALIGQDLRPQRTVRRFPCLRSEIARIVFLDQLAGFKWSIFDDIPRNRICKVDQPAGAALLVKTSIMRQIGGFNESYAMYFEDVDLCVRLNTVGSIIYNPFVSCEHDGEGTAQRFRRETTFWIEYSRRQFHRINSTGVERRLLVSCGIVSSLTHFVACIILAFIDRGERHRHAIAKAQGYALSLASLAYGDDAYWRSRFLR
jgi:N-acetylglucosaminyl-diphospho-decaprenol L-rhamnosyltransferase